MRGPILLLLACLAGTVPGRGVDSLDRNVSGDDVSVSVTSPFSELPPSGYVPYQVNIHNDRHSAVTWRVYFQGMANISNFGADYFEQEMTVPANSTGTFDVLAPLPATSERGSATLTIGVKGPGFQGSNTFAYIFTNSAGTRPAYAIIGENVLAPVGLGPLETFYKGRSQEFYGSEVDIAKLPTDWRAYAGVAIIFLKDTEWIGLNSGQREAVTDYVAQGGRLALFTSDNPDARIPELQLPEPDGKPGDYGFGEISVESTPAFPVDASQLTSTLEHRPALTAQNVDMAYSNWGLLSRVGTITVDTAFILSFVLLFGALVGPINLFVFARGRRFRLFWTTPLISILASIALAAGILLTDGLNGFGRQMIAVYSLPGTNREAVIQEQVCRTAVLFSNHWRNDQPYLIAPITVHYPSTDTYRTAGPGSNLADAPDTYVQIGNDHSGNWFRSRTVSGQYLQTMRPTRSVLTVMNPDGLNSRGEAPVVLSSYPQELEQLYLFDAQGHVWQCQHLDPGQKTPCSASTVEDYARFWSNACVEAGGKMGPALVKAARRPGCFYATGNPPPGQTLPTLGEIRWQVEKGLYLGPWVPSTVPEESK